jgi:DNA polymerase-3 subunit alpha
MAFLEMEDRIMGAELVAFPTVWAKAASISKKGSLILVRAKVQQGDEDYKLLADDIIPLDSPDLKQQVERLRRVGQAGRSGGGYGGNRSGVGAGTVTALNGSRTAAASASTGPTAGSRSRLSTESIKSAGAQAERVYVRIDAPHEQPATLIRLKLLLKAHPGDFPTVLRYERERRTVALSDDYKVSPTVELISEMEKLLGEGSIRVK